MTKNLLLKIMTNFRLQLSAIFCLAANSSINMKKVCILTFAVIAISAPNVFGQINLDPGSCPGTPATLTQTGTMNGKPSYSCTTCLGTGDTCDLLIYWDGSQWVTEIICAGTFVIGTNPSDTPTPPCSASSPWATGACGSNPIVISGPDCTSPPADCPDIAPAITDQTICAGNQPNFTTIESEVNATGNNIGPYTYFTDAAFTTAYTAGSLTNNTCDPITTTIYGRLQCTDATAAGNADEFDDFQFDVIVYPDANNFMVDETPGDCGTAATVAITAGNGDECFAMMGTVPTDPGCGNPDDMQNMMYSFDPAFPTACNLMFSGTVAATCAPAGCIDCPDITPAITDQEICAGEQPDFTTVESEVNATGNNIGSYTYFTDAAFTTAYVAAPATNNTCDPITTTIYGRLQCTDAIAAGTADEFDDFQFDVTVYPDANNFMVDETPGDCGTAATVAITAGNGDECFAMTGTAPTDPGCGNPDDTQDMMYSFDPAFPTACNLMFSGTVAATCAPTGCIDCPDIAPAITDQEICPGDQPDFTTVESEVNATGNNIGPYTYFTDAAFTTAYVAAPATNNTCDPITTTIYGRLQCTDAAAAGTDDEFSDFQFDVTVYPDANNFMVDETPGGCGTAATVSITAENGDECFAMMGTPPTDPGCGNPDDMQNMMYSFDPAFPTACNLMFSSTVAAVCAGADPADAAFDCPPTMINFCEDDLIIDLNPLDNNNVAGATGVFSGSGATYVIGNQDPGMGAQIDLTNAPIGTYTLEYTVSAPGCPDSATSTGCSFTTFINCAANGGQF